jgi:hypothetical protein
MMKMAQATLPAWANEITEREFWAALRARRGARHARELARAVRLGRRGQSDAAFAALAEYHRPTLREEWRIVREAWAKMRAPNPAGLDALLRHKITVWHTQVVQFGPQIDWWPEGRVVDNLHGLHRLHWLQPALLALMRAGEARYRDFVVGMIAQYGRAQSHPRWPDIVPVAFGFLGVAVKWPILWKTGEHPGSRRWWRPEGLCTPRKVCTGPDRGHIPVMAESKGIWCGTDRDGRTIVMCHRFLEMRNCPRPEVTGHQTCGYGPG